MPAVEVRDLTESDYEDWLRLFNLYLVFYKSTLPEEVKRSTFERCLDPKVDIWSALAIHPETKKPIGMANYLKHLGTWSISEKIYLNDLYVDEEQRLHGVGKSLIEYIYSKADEMGTPEVYWCTDLTNHRAQMLYTKVGWNSGKIIYKRPPGTY
ncbi:D-amino-acid N-acetyltransferase [Pichia californica]|uniref:D-amino-acid N-acetyltransferase n=1 Tax=Pichia californica TaxID=460514 RepID=A0A9P6WGU1_9ASCO|nr:D-amino-acid N-acetyltransferase [[Candida] californica]KAG0686591.1 D-amino-acid N-acetyltransferase [[Candida] californica]